MLKQTTFGQKLRELRQAKRLTQRELGAQVAARLRAQEGRGFDFTYLSKIENGKADPPSIVVIQQLAHILEADAYELIALAGKAPPEVVKKLKESEGARVFYRSALNGDLSEEDWKTLLQDLKRRKKARENPSKQGD